MVEEIEEFRAELQLMLFVDPEVFLQDQIEIYQFGATQIADSGISEVVGRRLARSTTAGHGGVFLRQPQCDVADVREG